MCLPSLTRLASPDGDYCHAVGAVVAVAAHLVELVPEATLCLTPAAVADACAHDGGGRARALDGSLVPGLSSGRVFRS